MIFIQSPLWLSRVEYLQSENKASLHFCHDEWWQLFRHDGRADLFLCLWILNRGPCSRPVKQHDKICINFSSVCQNNWLAMELDASGECPGRRNVFCWSVKHELVEWLRSGSCCWCRSSICGSAVSGAVHQLQDIRNAKFKDSRRLFVTLTVTTCTFAGNDAE